ncbi:hypothetical protein L1887_23769 [Cichorium endivia]|nr:hypothetical protein L1887_23769 [Cichorium endivia]
MSHDKNPCTLEKQLQLSTFRSQDKNGGYDSLPKSMNIDTPKKLIATRTSTHMLPGISNGGTRLSYFDLFHRKKSPEIIRKVKALASLFPISTPTTHSKILKIAFDSTKSVAV